MQDQDRDRVNAMIDLALGESAHAWFRTDLGKRVVLKAAEEEGSLQAAFLECESTDTKTMQEIQHRLLVARQGLEWLNEAIIEGEAAYQLLKHEPGQ